MEDSAREDVRRACAGAASAADALARLTLTQRAGLLRDVAAALTVAASDIIEVADDETHLGEARLATELIRTARQLTMFAQVVTEGSFLEVIIDPPAPPGPALPGLPGSLTAPTTPGRPDLRRWLQPLGPVAVFAASNFPLAFSVAGGDTASALAAGCPVVVKAHEGHPRLSALVARIVASVLPPGALSVVYGRPAGRHLVLDEAITAVAFTGSTSGGRALFDLASGRADPIPFYGELGSVNPVIVTPAAARARMASIVDGFVASFTQGQGQFCTKPGLLFLPAGHGAEDGLRRALREASPGALLGDWVEEGLLQSLGVLRDHPGVREVVSADPPAPTLLAMPASAFDANAGLECFGPASLLVEYESTAQLRAALASVPGSLTATIHGELPEDAELAAGLLRWAEGRAGRIVWNGWPTGVAVTWAMHHGGPWPAATPALHTSVGATAVRRFLRPVAYQDVPQQLLPAALRDGNPLGLPRRVDGSAMA